MTVIPPRLVDWPTMHRWLDTKLAFAGTRMVSFRPPRFPNTIRFTRFNLPRGPLDCLRYFSDLVAIDAPGWIPNPIRLDVRGSGAYATHVNKLDSAYHGSVDFERLNEYDLDHKYVDLMVELCN